MADPSSTSASQSQSFSERADKEARSESSDTRAGPAERDREIAMNLKEFGIDTDRMTEAANERVSDVQQMIIDEVRARPLRAVCWAATAGLVAGLLWAR